MKIPWIEIGVLIIVIAIGYQILSQITPLKIYETMCNACWKQNWVGEIVGEVSYSCEWDYATKQSFKDWCENNAPLFATCSDCNQTYDPYWQLKSMRVIIVIVIIIGIIVSVFGHPKEEKKPKKLKVKVE